MIHILVNHQNNLYYRPEEFDTSQTINYPENFRIESEQVKWVDFIVDSHNEMVKDKPEFAVYIRTNSMILYTAFRVAIKEKRLKAEQLKTVFIDTNGDEIFVHIDDDGRMDTQPEGFFDSYRNLLRKLM